VTVHGRPRKDTVYGPEWSGQRKSQSLIEKYRILKDIIITVIDEKGQDKNDWVVGLGSGEIWFDGDNVIFRGYQTGKRWTTINNYNFIESMVEDQRLFKISKEVA